MPIFVGLVTPVDTTDQLLVLIGPILPRKMSLTCTRFLARIFMKSQ